MTRPALVLLSGLLAINVFRVVCCHCTIHAPPAPPPVEQPAPPDPPP
jgi:hypothetical protein